MELFNSNELSSYFEKRRQALSLDIYNLSDNDIILGDIDEWKEYYFRQYEVEPIQVYEGRITYDVKQDYVDVYDSYRGRNVKAEGYIVKFSVPFDGDSRVIYLKPSCYHCVIYRVYDVEDPTEEREGMLTLLFQYRKEEVKTNLVSLKEFLFDRFERCFKDIRTMVSYVNNDIKEFNENLPTKIESNLKARKERADEWCKVTKALQIPLVLGDETPNIVPMAIKQRVRKAATKPKQKPQSPEYYIGDGDYDNIVNIINSCCIAMERSASTFHKLEEEEIRDFLTATLNTHYVDAVSGETFRRRGKTDILITFEGRDAFIGECKIWHGPKLLGDAFEQLLCYSTWRDLKTALVIFNKNNKNFDKIQKQIGQWVEAHSKSYKRRNGNVWDCVIYSEFHGHDIKVAVCLYDIMIKELPSSSKSRK